MGFYDDFCVPYLIELTCGMKDLLPERERAAQGLEGTVLEIGFGSGLNLPFYPKQVSRVLAVDPSARARKIGKKRIDAAHFPIDFVGVDAAGIHVDSASADTALSTFTLCSVPEVKSALREVKRILKPGGHFYFVEHGRSPDAGVARWQDRLNGVQQAVAGGCNLNRAIADLVREAGFTLESVEADYMPKAPKPMAYLYRGVARA